jgi:hypothetical protein
MPIIKKVIPLNVVGRRGAKPTDDKVLRTSIGQKSKKKSQVITKSKGPNIQIHINLSKRKTIAPRTSPSIKQQPHQQPQPMINFPPPVYALQSPSSSSSSMMDTLNLILAQNKRYDELIQKTTKKNIITGLEENPISSLTESVNRTSQVPLARQTYDDEEEEPPTEEQRYEEEEYEPQIERKETLRPISPKKMTLFDLMEYALHRYDISPYYEVEGKGRKTGQMIQKQKTKKQLLNEIEQKKKLALKMTI